MLSNPDLDYVVPSGEPCESYISELRGLDSVKISKIYPRGSVLFSEGQKPNGVYVLCEGRAKVSIGSAEGKTFVLRIAEAGDILGLNSVLADRAAGATVETIERCRVDFIAGWDLIKLLDRDKKASLGVARALGNKLSGVLEHARLLLLSQSAAEKLARLLMRWIDERGRRTAQGIQIDSEFTHEELAEMICTSRETVTRVLSELKQRRVVSVVGNSILIRNRKALESVAGILDKRGRKEV
jgi:CRP/FNR family transcriptional regulator